MGKSRPVFNTIYLVVYILILIPLSGLKSRQLLFKEKFIAENAFPKWNIIENLCKLMKRQNKLIKSRWGKF